MSFLSRSSPPTDSAPDGWISLPASTDVLHAIGGGHSFESALADIIDNSIDARASRVRIRFVLEDVRLIAVQIRDDGTGMSEETLVEAFRLGGRRDYKGTDLGHFGIGLKAASMRHANCLRVYSAVQTDAGLSVSAASLDPGDSPDGTLGIRVLDRRGAESGYAFGYESDPSESGTVIEWTGIRAASDSVSRGTRQEWLDHRLESTRAFLGLVFHRMLEAGDLRIEIDLFDAAELSAGIPRRIEPVNPFGYQISGHAGYPRTLEGALPDGSPIAATCHVLPPKGMDRGLPGKREDWQGLYVYRNARLLTVEAGWQGLAVAKSELRLARVAIDIADKLLPYVTPNPEKNGVILLPDYSNALQDAIDPESGISIAGYLDDSRTAWKESTKRTTEKPLTEVSGGLPALLLQQLGESFGWRTGHAPASIVWEEISRDDIFKVDLDRRLLVMNSAHAEQLGGEDSPQATAIAMLLYILVESNFTRTSHLRATTHDHLEQIDRALFAALYSDSDGDTNDAPRVRSTPPEALAKLRAALSASAFRSTSVRPSTTDQESTTSDEPSLGSAEPGLSTENVPDVFAQGDRTTEESSPANAPIADVALPDSSAPSSEPDRILHSPCQPGLSGPLDTDDLAAFEAYCDGAGIGEIAATLCREKASIAKSLALALFGAEAVDDDASLAPFHGLPYTPDERTRIVTAYRSGGSDSVVKIARDNRRTPLAIAWLLLDSPKRPVVVDRRVRKNVRRRLKTNSATGLNQIS
ncbi:hypothetical protein FCK90_14385 [Kocuria coralli]|uniref:ATP-binding protein n=1 Tax=Kocuria coralli TaxID=1461025 RepID=A0A5J5KTP6_9MICC|nr:ATP-binding protein [Kocuria coralli]KAA9393013.1 hypothetical protein FCK90_14385 [Kocuria coralli]